MWAFLGRRAWRAREVLGGRVGAAVFWRGRAWLVCPAGLFGYQNPVAAGQSLQAGDQVADDAEEGDEQWNADDEVAVPGHVADGVVVGDGLLGRGGFEYGE